MEDCADIFLSSSPHESFITAMTESRIAIMSISSFSTCGCISSWPTVLRILSLTKCLTFLTPSSSIKGKYRLLQTFFYVSGIPEASLCSQDRRKEDIQYISLPCNLCCKGVYSIQWWAHILPSIFHLLLIHLKSLSFYSWCP